MFADNQENGYPMSLNSNKTYHFSCSSHTADNLYYTGNLQPKSDIKLQSYVYSGGSLYSIMRCLLRYLYIGCVLIWHLFYLFILPNPCSSVLCFRLKVRLKNNYNLKTLKMLIMVVGHVWPWSKSYLYFWVWQKQSFHKMLWYVEGCFILGV